LFAKALGNSIAASARCADTLIFAIQDGFAFPRRHTPKSQMLVLFGFWIRNLGPGTIPVSISAEIDRCPYYGAHFCGSLMCELLSSGLWYHSCGHFCRNGHRNGTRGHFLIFLHMHKNANETALVSGMAEFPPGGRWPSRIAKNKVFV